MSDTTDPRTGFVTRSGGDPWGTSEPPQAEQAPEPTEPAWPDVGQGIGRQEDVTGPFDVSKFSDHQYWLEHRAELLASLTTDPLHN